MSPPFHCPPFHWSYGRVDAPLLLCLHGIGSCADAFVPQQELAERCGRRVVAWDAPGYRHSADPETEPGLDGWADAAADLISSLGYDRAAVLGVSWGGVTATRLALRHPELIERLIIADSSVGSGTRPDRAEAMRGRAVAVEELGLQEFAASRSPMLFSENAAPELVGEAARLMVDAVRLPPYQWACNSMADTDHRDDLASITAPTLVVCGDEDRVTPPTLSEQLHAGIARSELAMIPGSGHLANQEHPDLFNDALAAFLGDVS